MCVHNYFGIYLLPFQHLNKTVLHLTGCKAQKKKKKIGFGLTLVAHHLYLVISAINAKFVALTCVHVNAHVLFFLFLLNPFQDVSFSLGSIKFCPKCLC